MTITALVTLGIFQASERGQLLYFLQQFSTWLGPAGKPIANCTTCMAGSLWNLITLALWYWATGQQITEAAIPHAIINGLGAAFLAPAFYSLSGLAPTPDPEEDTSDGHTFLPSDCRGDDCIEEEELFTDEEVEFYLDSGPTMPKENLEEYYSQLQENKESLIAWRQANKQDEQ